jgi:hypothetical protein
MELLTFASAWWMQKFTPSIILSSDCTTMQHVGYHNTSYPGAQLCRCNFFTVFNLNPPDYNFFIAFNWILHDWINFFIAHFNFFSYVLKWELKGYYEHILQMHYYLLSIEPEHQSPIQKCVSYFSILRTKVHIRTFELWHLTPVYQRSSYHLHFIWYLASGIILALVVLIWSRWCWNLCIATIL